MVRTRHGLVRHAGARLACAAVAAVAALGVLTAASASAAPAQDSTFTQVSGTPNPTDTGTPFTVTGLECDRTRDVQATGTMVFTDVTTGVVIGTVSLGSSQFANCGGASVTDSEALAPGHYVIRAKYHPGGTTPVTASAAAKYKETVDAPTFTDLSWTAGAAIPHAHIEGASVGAGSDVYAISGATGDCTDGASGTVTSAVDAYNTATNAWAARAPIPNGRDQDPAAVDVSGKIYVIGGTSSCGGATVTAVDTYKTSTNTWTTLPAVSDLPASLSG